MRSNIAGLLLIAGVVIVSANALGGPDDWVEGTQALDDGATRDYYNRAALLPWDNRLGDWTDATGVAQGDSAYATVTMVDDDRAEYIEWDITQLVQQWVDGALPNKGLLLRNPSSGASYIFHSREHPDASQRPELAVTTAAGNVILPAAADTSVSASTFQGQGDSPELRVTGGSRNTLLRFDLASIVPQATVSRATLRLFVSREFGAGEVAVFRSSQGHSESPSDPIAGLAASFPLDSGLAGHASVFLFEDFEQPDWGSQWSYGTNSSTLSTTDSDPDRLFEPVQGLALRAKIANGTNTGLNVGYRFLEERGFEPEQIYFRYYLRFADDWQTLEGGKLPGLAGRYPGTALEAGWGGRRSNGSNGWSARGLFRLVPPTGNTFANHVPIGNYVYHADMSGTFGDNHLWQNDHRGLLAKNRWYCIETHLMLNSLGQNDGVMRGWIDGRLAWEKHDWRWRDLAELKIQEVWLNIYHGGTTPIDRDVHAYIDNIVIASSYIGPMAGISTALPAPTRLVVD